jgi:hypothetical protein
MSKRIVTGKQKEVLDLLSDATSSETADSVYGDLFRTAMNLADRGVLNLRLTDDGREVFWTRQPGEGATGASVPAGFVVALNRNIQEPSGKQVNFFVARTKNYDLTQTSFRRMLSAWLRGLGLTPKDVLTSIPVDQIPYDSAVFDNSGHVIIEDRARRTKQG